MNLEARLIDLPARHGQFNTNLDLALIREISSGRSTPALVFTEWHPTVSLGRSQSDLDINHDQCAAHNVEVVRRKSGGQVVYLDEGYVVASLVGRKEDFPNQGENMQTLFSESVRDVLRGMGVPAETYPPGNVILRDGNQIRTISNSGKVLMGDIAFVQGSVRYALPNFDRMIDVLQIAGNPLHDYRNAIQNALAHVNGYNTQVTKQQLKDALTNTFSQRYGVTFASGQLTDEEMQATESDASHVPLHESTINYSPKGICYLSLNQRNFVPALEPILPHPYNQPVPELQEVAA